MIDDNRIAQKPEKEKGSNRTIQMTKRFYSEDTVKKTGQVLQDKTSTGRDREWSKKRSDTSKLAESYARIGHIKKSEKVHSCTTDLLFKECPEGHEKHLVGTFACKARLCPVCAWRRSLVVFHQTKAVLHEANKRENLEYLFLTLTIKNCDGEELKEEIDLLLKAWNKLSKRKIFTKSVVGWFRALEITRNKENDTYHPHFHVILAVKPSYFKKNYVTYDTWKATWKDCLKIDYDPVVHIQKSRPKKTKAGESEKPIEDLVAEGAKYATKTTDYIVSDEKEMDKAVEIFDKALHGRRLIAYGGILKEIYKELKFKDETEADLVNIDENNQTKSCQCKTCGSTMVDHLYKWTESVKKYIG